MKWHEVQFGELCNLVNGKAFSETDWSTTGLPIIRIQNLNGSDRPFNHWAGSLDKQVRIEPGDMLLAWSGTPGTSFGAHIWNGPHGVLNQHIFRVDLDERRVSKEWAVRAVNGSLAQLIHLAHGGVGLKHVTKGTVENLKIPVPPLADQRRIAAILDQADALRAKRRATVETLDKLTESLYVESFGDPVRNPNSWPIKDLSQVCRKITDGEHLNPQFVESGLPMVMAADVLDSQVDLSSAKRITTEDGKRFRRKCAPERGDILLVSRGATIGRLCEVATDEEFSLMGSVILIKPQPSMVTSSYLRSLLKHPSILQRLRLASGSSAQQAIYLKDIQNIKCPIPELELQRRYTQALDRVNVLAAVERKATEKMNQLFSSLQHRAFRGEL